MVDHSDNSIIDVIDSRDIGDVANWLKKYPNLETVTRDGSLSYKSSIEIANPGIKQVSDRFHLIKGLSEAFKELLKRILPSVIVLEEIDASIEEKKGLKERFLKARKAVREGKAVSKACEENAIDIRIFKKLSEFNGTELDYYFMTKSEKKMAIKREMKKDVIAEAKKLHAEGISISEIGRRLGLNRRTIARYISSDGKTIGAYTKERTSSCTPYAEKISAMVSSGAKTAAIYAEISKMGFKGKYGTLTHYVRRLNSESKVKLRKSVSRKTVIKVLFCGLEGTKDMDREKLMKVYERIPKAKKAIELMNEFKGILLGNKSESALIKWFSKASKMRSQELDTFVSGCDRDIDAILNALADGRSNGVVEASVNKLKLTKRIMNGRSGFTLLRNKVLLMENLRNKST